MRAIVLTVALLTAGCVSQPARITSTASGRPEVTIATDDLGAIKGGIISDLVNYNYSVREDSDYRLVLARPTEGMESFGATLATGNAYSTNPDRVADFTFARVKGGIRVVASLYYQTQMAMGQIRTQPIDTNIAFNSTQELLENVKRQIESGSISKSTLPDR